VTRYVASRLIQLGFVLIGVSVVVFVTMHLLPGDVAQLLLGEHATNEQLQRLREQLGLNQPVWVQYERFMLAASHGDLGISVQTNHPALNPCCLPVFSVSRSACCRRCGVGHVLMLS
jgi:peptide/nickel transport system permease protein